MTSSTITANHGAYANVTIKDYTLKKDGQWRTICLPFDLDVENSLLAGADVRTLDGIRMAEGDVCILDFLAPVSRMESSVPYLIRWTSGDDIVEPVFNGVIVESAYSSISKYISSGSYSVNVSYRGSYYSSKKYDYDDWSAFYIGENQELSFYKIDDIRHNFDGYFNIYWYWPVIPTFVVNTGDIDDIITGIDTPAADNEDASIYNVAGQRLQKAQRGINIIGGKKVLVK